jgi:hypothetical protein
VSEELEKRASDAELESLAAELPPFAPVQEGSTGDVPPNAPRIRVRGLSAFGPVWVQTSRR